MESIKTIVARELNGSSDTYLREIIDHGIHNITNDFQGETDEEYEMFTQEFDRQARSNNPLTYTRTRILTTNGGSASVIAISKGIRRGGAEIISGSPGNLTAQELLYWKTFEPTNIICELKGV